MQRQNFGGREIYLEFQLLGDYAKVSVIDADTNIETAIVGTPRTTQQQLTRLDVRKLECVMDRRCRVSDTKPHYGITV